MECLEEREILPNVFKCAVCPGGRLCLSSVGFAQAQKPHDPLLRCLEHKPRREMPADPQVRNLGPGSGASFSLTHAMSAC